MSLVVLNSVVSSVYRYAPIALHSCKLRIVMFKQVFQF